jgi:hypothetical protein
MSPTSYQAAPPRIKTLPAKAPWHFATGGPGIPPGKGANYRETPPHGQPLIHLIFRLFWGVWDRRAWLCHGHAVNPSMGARARHPCRARSVTEPDPSLPARCSPKPQARAANIQLSYSKPSDLYHRATRSTPKPGRLVPPSKPKHAEARETYTTELPEARRHRSYAHHRVTRSTPKPQLRPSPSDPKLADSGAICTANRDRARAAALRGFSEGRVVPHRQRTLHKKRRSHSRSASLTSMVPKAGLEPARAKLTTPSR